ncbi:DUF3147 family protein [Pokkaliibacter sp. CJK22405]|uniref:DUF3147 family protein n=1 Tax=Pokkaliibacter sp. CJK22405 TaxID=3384615 RepID=UPI003984E978
MPCRLLFFLKCWGIVGVTPALRITPMNSLIVKYLITALMVVVISELAKRSDRLGALVASLPLVTVLTLVWLYIEQQPAAKIANHAWYTFWYVLPTLPMFLFFPMMMQRFGFWLSLLASCVLTFICFVGLAAVLKRFGVELW